MTTLDGIKKCVGFSCQHWTVVPWIVSVFPTYLPWLQTKFRHLLLKLCNGCWLWQSEETLSYALALLVWFWSLSFLLRSHFQSQVEGLWLFPVINDGPCVTLFVPQLLLVGEAKDCSAWGESTDYIGLVNLFLFFFFFFYDAVVESVCVFELQGLHWS